MEINLNIIHFVICGTALIQLVSTQHYYPHLERRHYTDESLTPYQRGNYFQSYIPNNYQSVPQYRRPIRRIYEDDMPRYRRSDAPIISSNEGNGRLLSPSTFDRISETLGALNTVGRYIVNMTRGGGQEQDLDPNVESDADLIERRTESVPNAILTLTKNVLGERVEKTIVEPIIKTVAPAVIEDVPEKKLVKKDAGKKKEVIEQPVVTRKEDKIEEISPKRESDEEITEKDGSNRCRTPEGRPGRCEDLSNCPSLLLDLTHLRESLCFKALFVPGVCCPSETTVLTTQKPIKLTPRPTPPTTTKSSLILTPQNPTTTSTIRPLVPLYTVSNTPTIRPIVSNEFEGSIVDPNDCGQQEYTSGRIVGGIEAPNGNWPWMAAIFLHGPKRTEFWCGGSLIGTKYILTAAHCTRDSKQRPFAARQFTVRLGDIDLSTDSEPSAPVTFKVKEVRAHPQFSRVGFYNDIAILVLEQPVRKSKYVIPVCLPQPALTTKERLSGRRATVIGFGTTYYGGKESPNLRQASLPIWRNEDCNRAYFQPITDNFLCAGYSEGNVDACQGDSGGPLMMQIEARWTQLGIVSFGNKCGEPGYPGVYTRISEYLEWIEQNTRN